MHGRTVAVTGAASGIGLAIARSFAALGDTVHMGDISGERLYTAAGEVGGDSREHVLDVSDFEAVERFVGAAALGGRLDVMVNAAGVFDGYAGIEETTPQLWDRIIAINLTGCFNGCKAAAAAMAEGGRIVSIGSVAAFRGGADGLAYAASKAGIVGMTQRLAVDLAPRGITANVICPGATTTAIRATSREILGDAVDQQRGVSATPGMLDALVPAGRSATPDEIASLAVYLASPDAGYVNGQAWCIDGGWTAQ